MPRESHRQERVSELLLRELAYLLKTEIEDPRVKTVSLTATKISPDLRHARIYFTTLVASDGVKAAKALNKAAGYLRRRIASAMSLRIVPALFFTYDDSLQHAQHLIQVINDAVTADQATRRQTDEKKT